MYQLNDLQWSLSFRASLSDRLRREEGEEGEEGEREGGGGGSERLLAAVQQAHSP